MSWWQAPAGELQLRSRVVVVGSGAGGAIAVLTLAEAGLDVVLLEDGHFVPPAGVARDLAGAMSRYYAEAGMRAAEGSPPVPVAGGRGLGGSTLVNSAICFRTPEAVLHEWNRAVPGGLAGSARYFAVQDAVEALVGVERTPDRLLSGNDRAHRDAARTLGWRHANLRRNTPGCSGCSRCNLGCPTGGKGSVDRNALPRAHRAGARIYTGCRVHRLVPGRVEGVVRAQSGEVLGSLRAEADAIVLAAGAIGTPRLLLDSGLGERGSGVGEGLRVHPVASVIGMAPEPVAARGATQGHGIFEFEGDHTVLESNPILPGALFQGLPLVGAPLQRVLARADHLVSSGALIRDRSDGQVLPTVVPAAARVRYQIGREDRDRLVRGLRRAGELWLEGLHAEWVVPQVWGAPLCRTMEDLRRALPKDLPPDRIQLYSSHPQASCGLGRALDREGQLREWPGIHVADASALPSNVGRNPQISVMTVARLIAERVARRLGGDPAPLT